MTEDSSNAASPSFLLDDDSRYKVLTIAWFFFFFSWFQASCLWLKPRPHVFQMQHSIFCGWHFQVNTTNRSCWYWSSTSYSRKLRLYILITTPRMISSGLFSPLAPPRTKLDVLQNLACISFPVAQCVVIYLYLSIFSPRL